MYTVTMSEDQPAPDAEFTLQAIAAASEMPVRTLRFYLAQGLLPSPVRQGQHTRYPASTLHRLTLLRRLRAANTPLAEIRDRLTAMSDADVVLALGATRPATRVVAPLGSASGSGPGLGMDLALGWTDQDAPDVIASPRPSPVAAPQRSQWERIVLEPGIELTVQRPLTRLAAKRVDRLVAYARELLIRDLADIT